MENATGQREETDEERLLRELEEELKIEILPQRQQPNDISELTDEQHDDLVLYKLNDEEIKQKLSTQLPIATIVDSMKSFVSSNYKKNIQEIEHNKGSYAALKRLLVLGTVRKLSSGWSRQLLQVITNMKFKMAEELIQPKQSDLDDFNERIGIPSNSILDQIAEKLRSYCAILKSPMGRNDEDSHNVPVVHPELCVSINHFTKNTAFTDGTYRPLDEARWAYCESPRISFNAATKSNDQTSEATNKYELLLRKHHGLFFFLIGPAGCGKTTLTKRMVKTWIEEKKMAFLIPFAQIDKDERLNLKYLLTDFICRLHNVEHDPSEEEIDEAFHWILTNQDKCLLIFDGLDQAEFKISEKLVKADINDELKPCDLLALILSRKFLPGVRLVLSTRPHSVANLAPATRPQIVIFLNDMLSNDVEKLMNHYLQEGVASEIMRKLRMKSPRIYQLIFNPLLLRLVVMLENQVGEDVWSYVNTTAKLFIEVIGRLQTSAHHEYGFGVDDVKDLNDKLGRMAFHKTMERSVVFTQADLARYGLNGDNVQDFLFGVMQGYSRHNSALLVGLMKVFYFNHQSIQEFFSAKFALEKLAVGEFKVFARKLFPSLNANPYLGVNRDFFANLRVLVIGCVNELKLPISGEVLEKKNFFVKYLSNHVRRVFGEKTTDINHQQQLTVDLLDFRKESVINEIHEYLKDFNFLIDVTFPSDFLAHREGLAHFLQSCTSKVKQFELGIDGWSENEIRRLFQAIHASNVKIECMWVKTGCEELPTVSDVVATFPQLTGRLDFRLRGDIINDSRRHFCRSLEEAIINFDTSLLQTEVLEVTVSKIVNGFVTLLLHVVLRRGQLHEIIIATHDQLSDNFSRLHIQE